jgi:malate/lactate dehydrogenase
MELTDCAYPLLTEFTIGTDSREVFLAADWIILLGGKPLSSGMAWRIDLLRANAPTMVEQGRAINLAARPLAFSWLRNYAIRIA